MSYRVLDGSTRGDRVRYAEEFRSELPEITV